MIFPGCACDELKLLVVLLDVPAEKRLKGHFFAWKLNRCFWQSWRHFPAEEHLAFGAGQRSGMAKGLACGFWNGEGWDQLQHVEFWLWCNRQKFCWPIGQWPNQWDATKDRCIGAWWTMGSVTVHLASDVWGDIHQGKLEPPKLTNKCWVVDSDFRRIPILKHTQSIPIWHRDMISEICFPSLPMTCDLDRLCQPVLQRRRAPSPVAFPSILR